MQTKSWGRGGAAREYRAQALEMFTRGAYDEALQLGIDDVQERFPDKYDRALDEACEGADEV